MQIHAVAYDMSYDIGGRECQPYITCMIHNMHGGQSCQVNAISLAIDTDILHFCILQKHTAELVALE
jgi:hypothetical protein